MIINGKKVISSILSFIQVAAIAAAGILEYLADKKMGVMRYLVFKNAYYEEIFLKSPLVETFKFLLILLLVTALVGLLYSFMKGKGLPTSSLLGIMVFALISYIFISFKDVLAVKAFPFFLLAFVVIFISELLKLITNLIKR